MVKIVILILINQDVYENQKPSHDCSIIWPLLQRIAIVNVNRFFRTI